MRYESLLRDIRKDARELVAATPAGGGGGGGDGGGSSDGASKPSMAPSTAPTPAPRQGNDVYIAAPRQPEKVSSYRVVDSAVILKAVFQDKMIAKAKVMLEKDRAARGRTLDAPCTLIRHYFHLHSALSTRTTRATLCVHRTFSRHPAAQTARRTTHDAHATHPACTAHFSRCTRLGRILKGSV